MVMSILDTPSYFARLLQPAAVAPATPLPSRASAGALPESDADMELQEVDLFVETEQPVNIQPMPIAKATQAAVAEPGDDAAMGKRIDPSVSPRQSALNPEIPAPTVHGKPALVSEQSLSSQPAPTEYRPAMHASKNAAEPDVLRMDSKRQTTHRTTALLDDVLRWVATPTQLPSADVPEAPAMDSLRPLSRLADPEDRPVPAALQPPPASVQAFRHPTLSSDRFPSGAPGTGRVAGGELPSEEVVRIAIGEIRVRIETPREIPREPPTETPRVSPPEMAASSHLSSGADASHAYSASGSLRRRCIHL